jgi:prophage regulatory protein
MTNPKTDCILRVRAVCERCGLSRATVWRLVKAGHFPRPFPLSSERTAGWLASAVDQWIADRAARRPLSPESASEWRRQRERATAQNEA